VIFPWGAVPEFATPGCPVLNVLLIAITERPEMEDLSKEILIAVTTFQTSWERTLILRKVLRHFRIKNQKTPYRVLVVSDGPLDSRALARYVDYTFCTGSNLGLHRGEHLSIRVALDFALAHGYAYVLKMGGDIICNTDEWVARFFRMMRGQNKSFLSTHWFSDDSYVFGTKFFLAHCELLKKAYPESMEDENLEVRLTQALSQQFDVAEMCYLINSVTGERHETRNELQAAGWQHAHKIYKFKGLDVGLSPAWRAINACLVYPGFRLLYNLRYLHPWRRH
jgi:hypothetical protein